jgi:hypothetical protein
MSSSWRGASAAGGLQAEVGLADVVAARHQNRALDRVVELAHVARPAVDRERGERVAVEARDRLAIALRVQAQEMGCEQRDVLAPLAQRGHVDLDRVEAEQQVLTEPPVRHLLPQVGVRGRKDAHVGAARARRADALELAGLEHAQQLRLQVERHVRDLVEEERAAVGHLEAADAVGLGVREGALHVAEQLALEDTLAEPAAFTVRSGFDARDETACSAGRHRALAAAVLAGQQHVRVGRADAVDHLEHRPASPRTRRSAAAGRRRAARGSRPRAAARGRSARDSSAWVRSVATSRAFSHGFCTKSRAPRRIASTATSTLPQAVITDHRQRRVERLQPAQQVHALAARGGVARVVEVDQHDVELARLGRGQAPRRGESAVVSSKPSASAAGGAPRARPAGRRRRGRAG